VFRWRPLWVRLHRYAGLATALFLLLAGLSGALLAFNHELDAALNPAMLRVTPQARPALAPGELSRRVEAQLPVAQVRFIALNAAPDEAVRLRVAPNTKSAALGFDEVFADPYDGSVLGQRQWGAPRLDRAHLLPFVYKLHRSLYLPDKWGVWLLGGVALIWLPACLIGLYLTLPKGRPLLRKWWPAWRVKAGASGYRLNFDLHRAGGLWLWGVLLPIAMSGVYFNLKHELFRPVVSLFGTLTPEPEQTLPKRKPQPQPRLTPDQALQRAATLLPPQATDLRPAFLMWQPERGVYRVGFEQPGRGEAFRLRFEQVYLDAASGELKARRGYDSGTRADAFLAWQFPLHSGRMFGLPGRLLVCLAGVATAMLALTGLIIWWKKRAAQAIGRRRRNDSLAAAAAAAD
jgi:uncharacterized iron-regulated membrane protein